MLAFVARRLALLVLLLIILSFGAFSLLNLAPGSPEQVLLAGQPATPETVQAIRQEHHLNDPFLERYLIWAEGAVRLDFGQSIQHSAPVSSVISDKIGVTLSLGLYGFAVAMLLAIPTGLLAAIKRGGPIDRVAIGLAVMGASVPAFATGLLLGYVFAARLAWLPSFGPGEGAWDGFVHLTLPAVALGISVAALIVKITRTSVARELDREYISFARARGMRESFVLLRYALRNALVPIVTSLGLVFVATLTNAVLVEETFALSGLGSLLVEAVTHKDIPVVQALTLLFGGVLIVVNIAVDVMYSLLDPRIELGKRAA